MSLCVVDGVKPNIVLPYNDMKGKTVQEILQHCNLSDVCLSYKNPFYTEVLHPGDKPLMLHPELCINTEIPEYPSPEYCLKVIPVSDKKTFWIQVLVTSQLNETIPLMSVPINTKDISSMTAQDLILACKTTFGYEFSDEKLDFDGEEIKIDAPAKDIIERCKKQHLHLSITISDQGRKKILQRGHITAEIISSEKNYVSDLQTLNDYWEPQFTKSKVFEEKEIRTLFVGIKQILQVHEALLKELAEVKPGFDTGEISFIFLRHLEGFTKATPYVSAYKNHDDMMKRKRTNKSVDKTLAEIEQKLPQQNGRNFMSYYITPVQRYPRYPLLFRELDKATPPFHPEKNYIQYTFQRLTEVNKKIDSISHKVLQMQLMEAIQKLMPDDMLIMDHNREIVEQVNVRIISKKSGPGILYLFNDLIMPCFIKKKQHIPIEEFSVLNFSFANGRPSKNSIYFEYNNEPYQLDFQDMNEKAQWFDQYKQVLNEHFKRIDNQGPAYAKWYDEESPGIGVRVLLDSCLCAGFAYFFGGTNESLQPTNTLFRYHITDSNWEIENSPVPPRESHTLSSVRGDLYICFGFHPKHKKVYNDIWRYSNSTKKWEEVKPNSETRIIARYGHTCVVYDNKLYFFGGKESPSGQEKDSIFSNKISCYDPHTNVYEEIPVNGNIPPARFQHAAVLVNKCEMAILGGRTEPFYDDVWVYDFHKSSWSNRSKATINKRATHKAVVLANRFIFVNGGLKTQNLPETVVIDSKSWTTIDFKQFGNVPPHLSKHAMVALDNNKLMLFGGFNRFTFKSYPSAWILDITDSVSKFVNASPSVTDEYWLRETPKAQPRFKKIDKNQKEQSRKSVEIDTKSIEEAGLKLETSKSTSTGRFALQKEKKEKVEKAKKAAESKKKKNDPPASSPKPDSNRRYSQLPAITPQALDRSDSQGAFGITTKEINQTISRLRRKTIEPSGPKPVEDIVYDRNTWKASGNKFIMLTMCAELGIKPNDQNAFEYTTTQRKCQRLWQKSFENNELEDKCKKMENLLTGNYNPPPGTSFLLKIFDDDTRCSSIIKIDSDTQLDVVTRKVCDVLHKTDPMLSIAVGNGEQRELTEKSLHQAFCCVYKGDMRCLTITAL